MSGFLSDEAVAERVLSHIAAGTTDRSDEVWREPVASYRSPERLEAERRMLARVPTVFCPSAALSEPGSWIARSVAGTALLVVRGRDGRVRAFRNACRHRGAELAQGSGCAKAFTCPYHGWTYRLDGRLQTISHADGFPGLDKEQHGLVPVGADERLGVVFVSLDPQAAPVDAWEDLPVLIAPEQRLLGSNEFVIDANWKVHLEGFIEGYHIKFAHKETFYPYGFDNLTLVEQCGPHSRVTYPFRRIEKLAHVPPADRKVDGQLTYVYHLFPNALVTILSRHTNLVILDPIDVAHTRVTMYRMTNRGESAEETDLAIRDSGFVNQTGLAEDLALVTSIQRSIDSGANEVFTFGHFESAIAHFHRTLGRALAEDAARG